MFAAHEVVATAHADGPALSVAVAAQDDSPTAMVAAQGDSPTATVASQDDGLEAAVTLPQKIKTKSWKTAINKDSNVTRKAARTVLDALAKIGRRELESCGVFTVPDLANLKVHCVEADPARKYICRVSRNGKRYHQGQRPRAKHVMAAPALKLKRSINAGCNFTSSYRRWCLQ